MDRLLAEERVKIIKSYYIDGNSAVSIFMTLRECYLTPLDIFLWDYVKSGAIEMFEKSLKIPQSFFRNVGKKYPLK